ncbi:MAG: rhomboid family intramembrane serine protease [Prolixibacteraceae bacterium]|nr:rhomboid family intramembrane serine protease [Prolixibacteraceae bacterium]
MAATFRSPFRQTPPVTKNLIIINVIMLLATFVLAPRGIDLNRWFALYYPGSEHFKIHQFVTHMFMHGGLTHLFFNMFALWMFGRVLENVWGPRRFLIFFFVTGLGAAALHTFVNYIEIAPMVKAVTAFSNTPSADLFSSFVNKYQSTIKNMGFDLPRIIDFAAMWLDNPSSMGYEQEAIGFMNKLVNVKMNIPTVGASGAVFGVLLGFGMLFPNTQLMLLFPPIPIKAKYMVIAYGVLELVLGLSMPGSNVAHFAHLGGMIFGFFLIKYWNKTSNTFY